VSVDWLQRWAEGRIGFHANEVNSYLAEHVVDLTSGKPARVLVPLCGKSVDLTFLADGGHEVIGVELAEAAAAAYFAEAGVEPTVVGAAWSSGKVQIRVEDFFATTAGPAGPFDAAYDRAAIVAIPEADRGRYVDHLCALVRGGRILCVSFAYDQSEMSGPPFSVSDDEVRERFGKHGDVTLLDTQDILAKEPKFASRGLTGLTQSAWMIDLAGG